jgi:uncharacterized membrane protein
MKFKIADIFQQMIGGFLLAGPFVVEGSVWELAASMNLYQLLFTVFIVLTVGYGALFKADKDRKPGKERGVLGVPYRYISLIAVSYGSVLTLVLVFSAPETFGVDLYTTIKAIGIASMFSVLGAGAADSVF